MIVFAVFWAALKTVEKKPDSGIGLPEEVLLDAGVLTSSRGVSGGDAAYESLLGW